MNLAEVIGRLVRAGMPTQKAVATVRELYLDVEDEFGTPEAEFCGELIGTRRNLGLSLGDCVCLTLAASSGAIAVTADRRWMELNGVVIRKATLRVELIR